MLPIHKNPADPLTEFRCIPDACYEASNFPKEAVKQSLLREQKYLCAYCMSRITIDSMSIEHWQPQHPASTQALAPEEEKTNRLSRIDYKNLLAVCGGNEGKPPHMQHCDTQKGNKELLYNPSNTTHHSKLQVRYLKSSGKIESMNTSFSQQLGGIEKGSEGILNLNYEQLRNNRLEVIKRIDQELGKLSKTATKSQIQVLVGNWKRTDKEGRLPGYAGVARFFLERRLSKAT